MASKTVLVVVIAVIVLALASFAIFDRPGPAEIAEQIEEELSEMEGEGEIPSDGDQTSGWRDIPITTIEGETFKISDFTGTPILLESFAVWCPICKAQQDRIRDLHEDIGDAVISISLDTDPNEDEQRVRTHVNQHGYDWRFAVSPLAVTQGLIDEFGITVVNAPSAPVVLICEDQSARFLPTGIKSANELKQEIEAGCS